MIEKEFWEDARKKNMYYGRYVLPYSALIHLIAFFVIDIYLFDQDIFYSSIFRFVPIIYLSFLYILVLAKNKYLQRQNLILFFIAGYISTIPVSYHAAQDLAQNNMLYSTGMGIMFIKVMMIMFVFLPKYYVYLLYFIIDLTLYLFLDLISGNSFANKIEVFLIFTFLANAILIIAYHVNLDLRIRNFTITNEIKKEIEFKNRYFNLLAHDMKSPVNLMQSVVLLLNSEDITEERKSQYYLKLDSQLRSLNNLIVNVLDWIRTNSLEIKLEKTDIDLNELVSVIIDNHRSHIESKELNLDLKISDEVINYDKTSLEIILNNLIRNAIKFSDRGEKISIEFENNSLSITNSGLEIDNEQIINFNDSKSNYAKNGTAGEKGHGLGLEIIKNLVEHNGSDIRVSKVNKKTSFSISF